MKLSKILVALVAVVSLFATSAQAKELTKVGVMMQTLANPFFVEMVDGVTEAAKKINPDCQVISLSGDNDLGKQVGQLDNLVAGGCELIVLNACNTEGIGPAVRRAKEAGVVVIAADVAAAGADLTIQSDNWQAGRQAGQYIVDKLGGKGKVIIVNADPVSAVTGRVGGAKEIFAKYPGIEILSDDQNGLGQRDKSLDVMSNLLTAFPEIDAVFAINDPSAIGSGLAIKQAGRENEMFVVGVDGSKDAIVEMGREGSILEATPAQAPRKMAMEAVKIGYDIMNGKKIDSKEILYPVELITRENMNSYTPW